MSNNKQTSIEWLIEHVKSTEWQDMYIWHKEEIFQQAKAMHEEQAFEFWKGGIRCTEQGGKSFDQYYNETFNPEKP